MFKFQVQMLRFFPAVGIIHFKLCMHLNAMMTLVRHFIVIVMWPGCWIDMVYRAPSASSCFVCVVLICCASAVAYKSAD